MKYYFIDLFCGAGGVTTGVHRAKYEGENIAEVIACVNHDATAIMTHAANHPEVLHYTEDIRTLDLTELTAQVQLTRLKDPDGIICLWASLECTNFSKAKGGMPRDADSRTLAEHLFRYIEQLNPDYYMDGLFYIKGIDYKINAPTLFDFVTEAKEVAA